MPLSSIVQVLLRLFALNWVVGGLSQLAVVMYSQRIDQQILVPVVLLLAGVLSWLFAPVLSRAFTRGADRDASLEGVSPFSLYSTAFVGIGLWFALANFARVFNWIHYYITYRSKYLGMTESGPGSFYELSQPAMTLIAGIILVATAKGLARKLSKGIEPARPADNLSPP